MNDNEEKLKPFSRSAVDKLFEENAMLLENADGVPEEIAEELFGVVAVNFAKNRRADGRTHGHFELNGCAVDYLTIKGFYFAATWYNMRIIEINREREE